MYKLWADLFGENLYYTVEGKEKAIKAFNLLTQIVNKLQWNDEVVYLYYDEARHGDFDDFILRTDGIFCEKL